MSDEREHLVYADENGNAEECTEECPGCHWEGNLDCEALWSGCDICDPDGKFPGDVEFLARREQIAQYLAHEFQMPSIATARWRAQHIMAMAQRWIDEAAS